MSFLFSFHGRIGRLEWWLGQLIVLSIILIAVAVFPFIMTSSYEQLGLISHLNLEGLNTNSIIYILCVISLAYWISLAISAKRYHDLNKTGFWVLVTLIPYIGALWQIIECGFFLGTNGTNDYDAPKDTTSSWSSDKYNSQDQSYNNIDEVIARHVAEHKYRSPNLPDSIKKPMGSNKPAFGKRT
ncbi:hypothetical protein NBRC116602_10860 [Hyphomicrobiales bacterium 4NK60-0047b]|jgi:uncharacterized membrane protein YhaH (DUF805 family)